MLDMYDVYSVYNVTPIMNIQGNLETGKELLWKKYGGVDKSGLKYILFKGDIIPEEGKLYIICSIAIDEGSVLYTSTPTALIPLENGISEGNLYDSEVVAKMFTSCENPKYMNGDKITQSSVRSVYDAKSRPVYSTDELRSTQSISKLLNTGEKSVDYSKQLTESKLAELAGQYNYFFVGKVTGEGQFGITEEGYPYIEYRVIPVYSIVDGNARNYRKQQFITEFEIPFIKFGGLTIYDDGVEFAGEEIIPEEGKLYMFTCTSTTDGKKLYSYFPYEIVPIEEGITEDSISQSELVKKYTQARKNPSEVANPIYKESGNYQISDYSVEAYINYLYRKEIESAEKENREPVFNYEDDIYKFPDGLIWEEYTGN